MNTEKIISSENLISYCGIYCKKCPAFTTDMIARIDPVSGKVKGYIDLTGIFPQNERNHEAEVLNGIAYDKDTKRIFVTGKMWAKLFEIVVTE